MKHINDILNESILDKDLGNKLDEKIIRNWIIKQCGENAGKAISFDKDGRIVFPKGAWVRFSIDDEIPKFIKIASCDEITIHLITDGAIIPNGFLPETLNKLEIIFSSGFSGKPGILNFKMDSLNVSKFIIRGPISELILPKKFVCNEFDVSDAGDLVDIKNMSKIKKANFPNKLGANLIRKYLKFQGELKINGFGPY